MELSSEIDSTQIAKRWCAARGEGWSVRNCAGRGGTAPVYAIDAPSGVYALKIYDEYYSSGREGEVQAARVDKQVALGEHDCPSLVKVYEGGRFEGRLYVLMSLAPGRELEKILTEVPRGKIRTILHQVAKAAEFLESKGLCHRDIKSANIFVSDDFEAATLLDVSVLRDINDPVGVGTDHGNQLPMIATARYSPPEYLFRLLEPGPESWHALNIYQLGGVLHDLIAREMMFEDQYRIAGDNRYRFAWAVASLVPAVVAEDVDRDLVDLARRSLDKDWRNRSSIKISDFFSDVAARKVNALRLIGFKSSATAGPTNNMVPTRVLKPIAEQIDGIFSQELLSEGILSIHAVSISALPPSATLSFSWKAGDGDPEEVDSFVFSVNIKGRGDVEPPVLALTGSLELIAVEKRVRADGSAAPVELGPNSARDATNAMHELLAHLAMRVSTNEESIDEDG